MNEIDRLTKAVTADPLDFSAWTVAAGGGGLLGLLEKHVSEKSPPPPYPW